MFSLFRKKPVPTETAPEPVESGIEEKQSWLTRLKSGMQKSAAAIVQPLDDLFNKRGLDDQSLQELEDILITADFGVTAAAEIVDDLRAQKFDKDISAGEVRQYLAGTIADRLKPFAKPLAINDNAAPHVILIIGVNGAGKTTTIGKMARQLQAAGHRVMLVAGDTFRAAASEQLNVWADRTDNVHFFYKPNVTDPAALAYEAMQQAKQQGYNVLLVDTAGRLHTKNNLMEELAKIPRVIQKLDNSAPHETLLILDATTGQNGIAQAEQFGKTVPLTGLIVTKLDGTARGGVLCAIAEKTKLPIRAIGVGEGIEDLQPFDADEFAKKLLGIH